MKTLTKKSNVLVRSSRGFMRFGGVRRWVVSGCLLGLTLVCGGAQAATVLQLDAAQTKLTVTNPPGGTPGVFPFPGPVQWETDTTYQIKFHPGLKAKCLSVTCDLFYSVTTSLGYENSDEPDFFLLDTAGNPSIFVNNTHAGSFNVLRGEVSMGTVWTGLQFKTGSIEFPGLPNFVGVFPGDAGLFEAGLFNSTAVVGNKDGINPLTAMLALSPLGLLFCRRSQGKTLWLKL